MPSRAMPLADARFDLAAKRTLDVTASLIGLATLWPLFVVIGLAIKLDSPGPVLFRQRRVGRDQAHFQICKFRTMHVDTPDLPTEQMLRQPCRITRLGKLLRRTSLDELPQLWNVLKGEMSLVGPRPALYNQDALVAMREAAGVHAVRPGITGWAQINGRDDLSDPEKVAFDRWYVEHLSLAFDLRILVSTCGSIASERGVN